MIRVLLVDDDRVHAEQLTDELNRHGLMTIEVASVDEAAKTLRSQGCSSKRLNEGEILFRRKNPPRSCPGG